MIHAEHTAATTAVESYRARLALFGVSDQDLSAVSAGSESAATFRVVAPASGIVTARNANVGLNVDPSMALVTVADLSEVWVVGEVYERDFPAVAVGTSATVTFPAYPELQIAGRVAYIDPQVKPETRTAQVRVDVPNLEGQLRLGMLAQISLSTTGRTQTMTIPRDAVQRIGSRTVVYVSNPLDPTHFTEREVVVGESLGNSVQLASGVAPGDLVVSKGSFSLRAERERLGSSSPQPPSGVAPSAPIASAGEAHAASSVQTARIEVTDDGYRPGTVSFNPGLPARLTFVRTSERTCGTEVVIPSMNIRRELPLNRAVNIDFTPKAGNIEFVCGMGMLKGSNVVR